MAENLPKPIATDKPFTIIQIKAYVHVTLNMEKLNYEVWRELFETHCSSFGVIGHIDGTSATPTPADNSWLEHDNLVKMWLYMTISESILVTVLKPKCSARDLWCTIEALFFYNKEALIGDLTVNEYCKKLKCIADLLANIESPVLERILVMHILNGLSDKFDSILNIIKHKSPFPSFLETRSMLQYEKDRLKKQIKTATTYSLSSSSPTLLYTANAAAPANNNSNRSKQTTTNCQQQSFGGNHRGRGRGRGGRGNHGRGGR
ncbi:hypothetical protein CARUB_v10019423mg [Capsella rubella]|uniref:Retrotransposon Copia-like N-terminal domain-containing protein n=1 Tax=Capsella rubella TaxID=81985 RepID=R0FT70_9BRAS|nr:hypothetical protein CARUB_v10019423mg [Capsella rubella]